VSGTAESVKEQLTKLATDFEADEIMVSTMADTVENRIRSFQLISEAFNLREPVL
jgi:hypothetical protein